MQRSVDFLIREHPISAWLSSVAFASLMLAFLAAGIGIFLPSGVANDDGYGAAIGLLLGLTLFAGLAAMILTTIYVIKERRELLDWGIFLIVSWIIPYFGVACYLGVSNLAFSWRHRSKVRD